jgi:type IV pilus assembly protein PilA
VLQRLRDRVNERDEGFTLIELMVVVLIIAILIAIAIPTFLGARTRAQDRAAQSSLRNTLSNAKAIYTDNEDYEDATHTAVAAAEPSLTINAAGAASTDSNMVSVEGGNDNVPQAAVKSAVFYGAALSSSNTCWYVRDAVAPGITPGTTWAKDASAPACTANAAEAAFAADATDWKSTPGAAVDIS